MRDEYFASIIRQKLQGLEMAVDPSDWEDLLNRLQMAFDQLIKEKLTGLALTPQEGDWEAMQESLHQAVEKVIQSKLTELRFDPQGGDWGHMTSTINEEPFDAFIAAKLGNAHIDELEMDWDQFSTKLDEEPLDTAVRQSLEKADLPLHPQAWVLLMAAMEEAFDESIRQTLANYEVPFHPHDWPIMASNLDDSPFDGIVRDKLTQYQTSFQTGDWIHMLAVLEAPFDEHVREKLAAHDVPFLAADWKLFAAQLDAALMPEETAAPVAWYANWRNYFSAAAAVLLLIFAMLGGKDTVRFRSHPDQLVILENNSPVILPQSNSPLQITDLVINPEDNLSDPSLVAKEVEGALPDQNASPALPADNINPPNVAIAALQPISESNSLAQKQISSQLDLENFATNLLQKDGKIPHESDPGSINALYEQIDLSDIKRVGPIAFGNVLEDRNLFDLKAPASEYTPLDWRPAIRLGLYAANARTWAELTGNDPLSGYSYGVRIEMKMTEQLRLVSGFNYSEKRFHYTYPALLNNRRFVENVLDGQLFLIEAPLMLRYDFAQHEKTGAGFYLQAGALAQLSTQENYWHYDPNNPANLSLENSFQMRTLSPEKLERGYNTYIGNLQAAIGVEYPITERLSAQLEPYLILGLQPTKGGTAGLNKRLSTVGIGFGLVYDLKKNKALLP
jgi:hypothetical protein